MVDLGLLSNIHEIWEASGHTYGADRVHRQLCRDGIRVGRKRVERLMAAQGWQGAFLRRGWRGGAAVTTEDGPFMSSVLPVAGFAIIEAATLAEAIDIVSRTPCAVAYGVVEVWPLQEPQ
ncbi:IS3 family transposase [Micromonospora sp. NPDC023633]|uniref:IS3 family transposase n=1 Tax=Micromonospora sp. NPDC023633 TaxID=3154320 RepID=UPI003410BEBA